MNYLTMKLGAFGAGLLGGLLVTFLWLGVSLAAGEGAANRPGLPALTDLGRPAAQTTNRIAGPPPLALRLSSTAEPTPGPTPGPSPLDEFIFLPVVVK